MPVSDLVPRPDPANRGPRPITRRAALGGGVLLGLGGLGALAGCGGQARAEAPPAPGRNVGTELDQALPDWVSAMAFTDGAGRTVRFSDYADKVVVLADTMTLCQESCPIHTATVVQTAEQVAAAGHSDKVEFLSVTVDPARDNPAQIAAYQKLYRGAPANWQVLTGRADDINRLWSYFGVFREKGPPDDDDATNWRTGAKLTYDIVHSDEVFFFAGGRERFLLEGTPNLSDKSKLPPKLYKYLNEEGRTNLAHPEDGAWTTAEAIQVISWLAGTPVG